PADALEPALENSGFEDPSNEGVAERLARTDNAIASFPISRAGNEGDAVAILRPDASGWTGPASASRIERGSFQLELKSADAAPSAYGTPDLAAERDRIRFE